MLRKIKFLPVDLYQSDATRFLITPDGLLMPLVSIPGLGETAAQAVVKARAEGEFVSIEDLKNRARLSSNVIEVLTEQGFSRDCRRPTNSPCFKKRKEAGAKRDA